MIAATVGRGVDSPKVAWDSALLQSDSDPETPEQKFTNSLEMEESQTLPSSTPGGSFEL